MQESSYWRSWMLEAIGRINPLQRLINSDDLDRAAEIVTHLLPGTEVHEYLSGSEIGSWIVPQKWTCRHGFMKDESGCVVASTEECPLFVAFYSQSVDGWFTKKEIADHLRTRPDRPNAFALEHRYAYNYDKIKDWGITLPHNRWLALPEDAKYHIQISVETKPGTMKVLSLILPGRREDTFCLNAHIDELCNDDLSGCVVAMAVMKWLALLKERRFTYQMLLSPELIGTLAYVATSPDQIARTFGTLNLEILGAGDQICLKKAYTPDSYVEKILRLAFSERKIEYRTLEFFDGYGNDERVYEWPGIRVPSPALQRYPFNEYHTSDDNLGVISGDYLVEAVDVVTRMVQIMEEDWIPEYTSPVPPYLSRFGLYFDATFDRELFMKFNNLVLFEIDGKRSVAQIADRTGIPFHELDKYLRRFLEPGLIDKKDLDRAFWRGEGQWLVAPRIRG